MGLGFADKPVVSSSCARCSRRADFGKAYLCCEDCSPPTITDKNSGEGYCMTGARLALTLKPLGEGGGGGSVSVQSSRSGLGVRVRGPMESFGVQNMDVNFFCSGGFWTK